MLADSQKKTRRRRRRRRHMLAYFLCGAPDLRFMSRFFHLDRQDDKKLKIK
jgi:hypothetical protein